MDYDTFVETEYHNTFKALNTISDFLTVLVFSALIIFDIAMERFFAGFLIARLAKQTGLSRLFLFGFFPLDSQFVFLDKLLFYHK